MANEYLISLGAARTTSIIKCGGPVTDRSHKVGIHPAARAHIAEKIAAARAGNTAVVEQKPVAESAPEAKGPTLSQYIAQQGGVGLIIARGGKVPEGR